MKLPKVVPMPAIPSNLNASAKWISGEGAGSWFVILSVTTINYKIARYSAEGELECEADFMTNDTFDNSKPFDITYPSHCKTITYLQDGNVITFNRIPKNK